MTQTQGASKVKYPAPLPLEVAKVEDDAKTLTFKLFSNPGDTSSPKVNKTIYVSSMGAKIFAPSFSLRLTPALCVTDSTSAGVQLSIRLWISL